MAMDTPMGTNFVVTVCVCHAQVLPARPSDGAGQPQQADEGIQKELPPGEEHASVSVPLPLHSSQFKT